MKIPVEKISDLLYDHSIKINIISTLVLFLSVWKGTSFFNAVTILAFHVLFTGIIFAIIKDRQGLSYIQFERYRDDINDIKYKRVALLSFCFAVSAAVLLTAFSNINIYNYIM